MRRTLFFAAALLCSVVAQAAPQVGEMAPDFTLVGSDGESYSMAQFRGKRPVVIAFFPKAFTGG